MTTGLSGESVWKGKVEEGMQFSEGAGGALVPGMSLAAKLTQKCGICREGDPTSLDEEKSLKRLGI